MNNKLRIINCRWAAFNQGVREPDDGDQLRAVKKQMN